MVTGKDVHVSTYLPDCPQCIGTICKYRHGGTRNTTPISTPTNQPSNSPNSHRNQYCCTHSGLPCSLPQPIPIPTTGGKHHGDTSHRGMKPLDPSVSPCTQNKSYQLWGNPTTTGTSADTSGMCPSSLHTSGSTIHPHYPHQVAIHLQQV